MKNARATRAKLPFMLRNRAICDVIVVVVEVVVYASLCLQHAFQHIHMKRSMVCTSMKLIIFLQRYVRHTRYAVRVIVRKDEFTLVMADQFTIVRVIQASRL